MVMEKYRKPVTVALLISMLSLTACATTPGADGKCFWSSPATCIAAHTAGGALLGAAAGFGRGGDGG
jgi:predicted small secreted protein